MGTLPEDTSKVPLATGLQTALLYPSTILAPGQSIERQYTVYAGPKEYNMLARMRSRSAEASDRPPVATNS